MPTEMSVEAIYVTDCSTGNIILCVVSLIVQYQRAKSERLAPLEPYFLAFMMVS